MFIKYIWNAFDIVKYWPTTVVAITLCVMLIDSFLKHEKRD